MAGIRLFFMIKTTAVKDRRLLKGWLNEVMTDEGKKPGSINFIFSNDQHVLELNREYLKHDYLTDILTFPMSEQEGIITGDIYISIERVKENAGDFGVKFSEELKRVMVHGILHMCGYKDKTRTEQKLMRQKEDHYLQRYHDRFKTIEEN